MSTYYIKQGISIRDKYNVYDYDNNLVFKIKGDWIKGILDKLLGDLLSIGYTLKMFNLNGDVETILRRKAGIIFKNYDVKNSSSEVIAVVNQNKNIFKPKLEIKEKEHKYSVTGDIVAKIFSITRNGAEIAKVRKKLIALRDIYVVDIYVEEYANFILTIILAIDNCYHN